ncbi:MAG: cytochrome c-type biogenesis protein, partial [Gemmatimonadota bacterium]
TDRRAAALDAQSAEIAARLRCPVCSGQSVLESNAPISQEMQQVIRERLERGETEEEIVAYFRSSYGDWIVLQPRPTGWNLLVYVLPAVVLIAGGGWLFVTLRRWSAGSADRPSATADDDAKSELSDDDEEWLRRSIGGT